MNATVDELASRKMAQHRLGMVRAPPALADAFNG